MSHYSQTSFRMLKLRLFLGHYLLNLNSKSTAPLCCILKEPRTFVNCALCDSSHFTDTVLQRTTSCLQFTKIFSSIIIIIECKNDLQGLDLIFFFINQATIQQSIQSTIVERSKHVSGFSEHKNLLFWFLEKFSSFQSSL